MSASPSYILALTAVSALLTVFIRAIPFLFFGGFRKLPSAVEKLGQLLPSAMIAILVVYCVRNTEWASPTSGLATAAGLAAVAGLHLWKRNTALSIAGGTVIYMILIRL